VLTALIFSSVVLESQDGAESSIMYRDESPRPLVFFSVCAVADLIFGLIKWHSFATAITTVVCGLPLTGLLFLLFRASWKRNGDSSAPR